MAGPDTAVFTLELDTKGLKGEAASAAGALQDLRAKIDADVAALANMQKAMRQLQQGTSVDVRAFKELRDKIDATKSSIAQSQGEYIRLGGTFEKVAPATADVTDEVDHFGDALKGAQGPAKGLLESIGKVAAGGALPLMAAGLVAVAVAMAAVTAAAAAAAVKIALFGVSVANARRDEALMLQGMTKIRNFWGIAAGNAGEIQTAIDRVSSSTATGREQVSAYAQSLYRAGLRGASLQQALEGVSIVASTQGEAQAELFKSQAVWAARSGVAVKKLSDDVKARLGGIAKSQLLSLDVQSKKLHESFAAIFSGLNIDAILGALHEVTNLFNANSATGKALKVIVEAIFQPMINAIGFLGPYAKRFFQGIVIGALLLTIVLLRVRNYLRDTFGGSDLFKNIEGMKIAIYGGVAAFALFAAVVFGTIAAVVAFGAMLAVPVAALVLFLRGLKSVFDYLLTVNSIMYEAGKAVVTGFANGILASIDVAVAAVKKLGKTAKDALMHALDAHSPSKLFAKVGLTVPQGFAAGVHMGAPVAQAAVSTMVAAPAAAEPPAASENAAAPRANRGAVNLTVNIAELHAGKPEDAQPIAAAIKLELEKLLSGVAVQLGAVANG